MTVAKIKIVGLKPIIFHKFNLESLTNTKKPKSGSAGNDPEEWKVSFFHDKGRIYIPGAYLFAALKNGSIHTKVGRGTIQKTWVSAVNVVEEKVYMDREMWAGWADDDFENVPNIDSGKPLYVDVRMVANPNTKGRNARYRLAASTGWRLEFSLDFDETLVSASQVKTVVQDTGKLQGIADGRSLGYGRYELESIEFEK